jgi:hypothetical protein
MTRLRGAGSFAATLIALVSFAIPAAANVIDGRDDRGPLPALAAALGLSAGEVSRIRQVSGHVSCFGTRPATASGALFLANDLVLTAGHTFFENGSVATKCFFRPQTEGSEWIPLKTDAANARFGANPPKPGSNNDWAVVRLAQPVQGVTPFPPASARPKIGDELIALAALAGDQPGGDPSVPIATPCKVRRVPVSSAATSFYRSDCDATGGASGGMHLTRIGGALVFRGITITTGPWRDPAFVGKPYDEKAGSVTTALGTDAAILAAARALAGKAAK